LPETKLGILPGFGGTQRLPRLIGLPKALDIILAGKTLKPGQARSYGLVSEIVPYPQLVERAEAILLKRQRTKEKSISLIDKFLTFTSPGRKIVQRGAEKQIQRATKGFYPAQPAALQSCLFGLQKGLKAGFDFEAKELGRLLVTPESKALVRLFFLTEDAKGIGRSARAGVSEMRAVVVGAGIMGAGIASSLARRDIHVVLKDTSQQALDKAIAHIKEFLDKRRHLKEKEKSFILNRIETTTSDSANIGNATIAIEAIVERMDVKKAVFSSLSEAMPEDAILATNTSSLSVSEIAESVKHPERVVGMHFFNPVEKMPLVEIVRGEKTDERTTAVVAALTSKLGKFPIVVQDVPGFLVNRILTPYLNEAGFLLVDGYSISDIDSAAVSFGMPMGPVRLLDEVGLDVAMHVSEVMVEGYGSRMKSPGLVSKMVQASRLGKKSGKGFYDFSSSPSRPAEDIVDLLGLKRERDLGDKKVVIDRLVMSLINEAVLCLDEGVAGTPGEEAAKQIDLGTVMGTGFPPFRGGLLFYAEGLGAKAILQTLRHLEKQHGDRFQPVRGIVDRAESGKSFFSAS
ncbi:MAG: fatty oxidation complex subunit alpha, partial [Bdellovibrionales bacterium]|nr:fatty oxidation complex subunit alpha [Bdellovibrionales bacterium]